MASPGGCGCGIRWGLSRASRGTEPWQRPWPGSLISTRWSRLSFLQSLVSADRPPSELPEDPRQRAYIAMLHFSLWPPEIASIPIREKLKDLWADPWALRELRQLLPVLREAIDHQAFPLSELPDVPLQLHCHYSLSEILAAFGVLTCDHPHRIREGVYYHEESGCDLFFVTIQKNEKRLQPLHALSGLRHFTHPLPLGVAEHHAGGLAHRDEVSEPSWKRRASPVLCTWRRVRMSGVGLGLTYFSGLRNMWDMRGSGLWG